MIYGQRIKQAREVERLTQKRLSELTGINQSAIAHLESGRNLPSPETISDIASATGFLPSFFEREPSDDIPLGSLVYRARSSMTSRQRNCAYNYAAILVEQARNMAVRLELPPNRLPMMPENPVTAAQVTRTAFGASPDVRLPNLTHLMEKNGVFVLAIPFAVEKIDAFSFWTDIDGERPIVTFLDDKPGDRLRWTAAHELGHLVMHRQIKGRLQSVEREADEFAEELLMPEALARQLIVPPVTLVTVARLKSSFGASMAAIIRRAHNLGIISDRRYRYLFEQLSKNGWRKREPANLDIPVEKPRMFRKMLNMHYGRTVTLDRYSLEMGLAKERAVAIINAHSKEEERIFEDESVVLFASS